MRYLVLGFLCAATVIAYLQRLALSAPTKIIEGELGLGPEGMGMVMAVWYWGYALCQIPSGIVADRVGSKIALILFAIVWSALTALTGLATGFWGLMLLWGLMGCTQAGMFPCATKAIGATFPRTEQAFASGALAACMALGAAVAQWLTPQLFAYLTWQEILVLYSIPGIVWAGAYALIVSNVDGPTKTLEEKRLAAASGPVRWLKLVTDSQMQLICVQQFTRASAVAFFYTWFPRFLKETRGITEQEAGELAFWPPLAGMVGGLLGGAISEFVFQQTGSARLARQGLAVAAMVVCTATALGAYFATDTTAAVVLLGAGAFCGMAAGVSGYAVAIAYGGKRVATVFATMNMSGNIGAGLFPFVVGWLVAFTGNWNLALLVFAGLFAVSGVCWLLLNPKGTLFDEPEIEP